MKHLVENWRVIFVSAGITILSVSTTYAMFISVSTRYQEEVYYEVIEEAMLTTTYLEESEGLFYGDHDRFLGFEAVVEGQEIEAVFRSSSEIRLVSI